MVKSFLILYCPLLDTFKPTCRASAARYMLCGLEHFTFNLHARDLAIDGLDICRQERYQPDKPVTAASPVLTTPVQRVSGSATSAHCDVKCIATTRLRGQKVTARLA
jgi:hypothetical protein